MTKHELAVYRAAMRDEKHTSLEASVHRVIAAYVAHLGGRVVVSGPIQIQNWPGEGKFRYRIALCCLGRKPKACAVAARAERAERKRK